MIAGDWGRGGLPRALVPRLVSRTVIGYITSGAALCGAVEPLATLNGRIGPACQSGTRYDIVGLFEAFARGFV